MDWTVDPKTGRSNSSEDFQFLSEEVASAIRSSAHDLLAGNTETVGRRIMAMLAHKHHLAPLQHSDEYSA